MKLPELTSISGRTVPDRGKRVFMFFSRNCGSCEYLSIAIPRIAKMFNKLTWVYIEKTSEKPVISNVKINNLYIVRDKKFNLSSIFKSKYTPTFFFIDKNNKIVWKRTGFIPPDYYLLKDMFSAFESGKYSLLDKTYQRNLVIGKKFPEISILSYPNNKKIILPDGLKGKPTMIFIFQYSCKACLDAMNSVPSNLKSSKNVNKVIVFSPFSEKVNKQAISFAKEFGFNELYENLNNPIVSVRWSDVNRSFANSNNTVIINDADFRFQYSIGWPGAPVLIVLGKDGKILYVIYLANFSKDTLKTFYKNLYKNLLSL